MIIHHPEVHQRADEVVVSATVESQRHGDGQPDVLWFAFPNEVGDRVTDRADGFATALLPLAMHRGEPLTVHGGLSYRLARGLREYQSFQATSKPRLFRLVPLSADSYCLRNPGEGTGAVASSFSGGVDSFYTLQAHLGDAEPFIPYRVSHCLMINGFDKDADLANEGSFREIQSLYEPMMDRAGVRLVVVRTNLLQFLGKTIHRQAFSTFLAAPVLILGSLFSRFFVPSSYKFTSLGKDFDGSHPMFDHLLASESLETIHDGSHLTRVEKTVAISAWPETRGLLRVCHNATGVQPGTRAIANCCECEKCLRTMVTLDIAGVLQEYRCFPKPLTPGVMRRVEYGNSGSRPFAAEILEFARQRNRPDIARDLRWAMLTGRLYRARIRSLTQASDELESRSRAYSRAIAPAKWLFRRTGLGRGWLY